MGPFQLGTAVAIAYDENGMLGVQADSHGEKGGGGRYVIGAYGLIGRPMPANDPETNAQLGASCLYADEGPEGFAWLGFDPRDLDKAPPLSDGSVALMNSRGSFFLLDRDTDTATLYQVRSDGTKAHTFVMGQDSNGKEYIELRHTNGAYCAITETSAVLRHSGNALIEVKSDSINLNGKVNTTASMSIGGAAAQSVPLMPQLLAYLTALEAVLATISAATVPTTSLAVATFMSTAASLKAAMASQMLKGL
jgi:hypothetical protein